MQDRRSQKYMLFSAQFPVPLAGLDRNTTEAQTAVLAKAKQRLPGLQQFEQLFDTRVRLTMCDRFAANLKGERALKQPGEVLALIACTVHMQASALKKATEVAKDTESGLLTTSLALQAPGSLNSVRRILQDIFAEQLVVVYQEPPEGEVALHRRAVLDLFLSPETTEAATYNAKARKRQFILHTFANSRLDSPEIIHFCHGGCCKNKADSVRNFQRYVTWSLLPKRMPLLSRKNWAGADASCDWLGLLSCFWSLASTVLLRYLGSPQRPPAAGGPPEAAPPRNDGVDEAAVLVQGLLQDPETSAARLQETPQDEPDDEDACDADPDLRGQEPDWHALNRQRRKDALLFCSLSTLSERMVVLRYLLQPAMRLLHASLLLASEAWEVREQRKSSLGTKRTYRVLEMARSTLTEQLVLDVQGLFSCCPHALPRSAWSRSTRRDSFG